jgi:hypothetical protein
MLSNFVQARDRQAALGKTYSLQITPPLKDPFASRSLLIKSVILFIGEQVF